MSRFSTGFGAALLGGAIAAAAPAAAQAPAFYLELNNATETEAGCDATFFISNRTDQSYASVTLYVVVFDRNSVANSDIEIPIGRLAAGKAGVQGAQAAIACSEISALFVNGITCGDDLCPAETVLASRAGIPLADDESVLVSEPQVAVAPPSTPPAVETPPAEDEGPLFIDTPPSSDTPPAADTPEVVETPEQEPEPAVVAAPPEPSTLLVSVSWPSADPADDIDTFLATPDGSIVWYHEREAANATLIRDDRGNYREEFVDRNGQSVPDPTNLEQVSIQPGLAGEYIVNVYHYVANGDQPVPVEVRLERVNGATTELIHSETVELDHRGQEETGFRFTLDADGSASGFGREFVSVVDRVRSQQ